MITTNEQLLAALTDNTQVQPKVFDTLGEMLRQTACYKLIQPTYEDVCKQALNKFKPVFSNAIVNKDNARVGKPIENFLDLHLAGNEVSTKIKKWHKAQMIKTGEHNNASECPFTTATKDLEQSKYDFALAFSELTHIDPAVLKDETHGQNYLKVITAAAVEVANESGLELGFFVTH
ncbi:MAG: hypothetical protein MJK04_20410 [Psychrosphaera sp.]|nr:hypothetical protein [Psychrosphaera sp.]